jgi:hypothetical protein
VWFVVRGGPGRRRMCSHRHQRQDGIASMRTLSSRCALL